MNFNGKETDKNSIVATKGSVNLKNVNSGKIENASISGNNNITLDKFNTNISKSSLNANRIEIKNSSIKSTSTTISALPKGVYLTDLKAGNEFSKTTFRGNNLNIENLNVVIKESKFGEEKNPFS